MIKELLWRSSDKFKDQIVRKLINNFQDEDIKEDIQDVNIKEYIKEYINDDINYNQFSNDYVNDKVMWSLLYYSGYLTYNNGHLCIPNKEVLTEWMGWIQTEGTDINSTPNSLLNMLLEGNLEKFEKEFPELIMNVLSYDVRINQVESNYHLLTVGLFIHAHFCGYKVDSNKESGLGRFDCRIEPREGKNCLKTTAIMEFKISNKSNLLENAIKGFNQIMDKKYYSDLNPRSTKLIESGIAFCGKQVCVVGRVLEKNDDGKWIVIYCSKALSDHMNVNEQIEI
jgi:hypothetical protein